MNSLEHGGDTEMELAALTQNRNGGSKKGMITKIQANYPTQKP